MNFTILEGSLSSDPRVRELPSGSTLRSYEVTTRDEAGTRSVPVVWFDAARPPTLRDGDRVVVVGSVQRRFFRAEGRAVSRTEVVAGVVAKTGSVRADRAYAALKASLGSAPRNPREARDRSPTS